MHIYFQDSHGNTPLAWAREMNANSVINELTKRGGIADQEWQGEKLEMKTNEQREEEWAGEENQENAEAQEGEEKDNSAAAADRFEIEIDDSKSKKPNSLNGKDSHALDALQRQRPTANAVY